MANCLDLPREQLYKHDRGACAVGSGKGHKPSSIPAARNDGQNHSKVSTQKISYQISPDTLKVEVWCTLC